ncbi:MAG TPA: hypothetical protein VMH79_06275 [Thermoanaerobaculia bacterium]|nr:hypothetical protein [Thermoanaerobaculia bacterium]
MPSVHEQKKALAAVSKEGGGRAMKRIPLALLGATLLSAGCKSIGPATMNHDRLEYTGSVADSWQTQMLLNLVKIRYGDTPVFLDVGQIVAGYSFQRTLGASASVPFNSALATGTVGAVVGGTFNESPTITYSPMTGERFARSLMTPIPPSVILNLIQAGYPVDEVFRESVQSINHVDNRRVGRDFVRRANPEFYAILPNLSRLQMSGDIGVRVEQAGPEAKLHLIFRPRIAAAEERALQNVAKILGLDPAAREIQVVYGTVERNDREIALLTRSIFEILTDMASSIEVPEAHVTQRRVNPTPDWDVGADGPIPPLIRVASSTERPADALVSVPYRGYWFSIDDKDIHSKQIFSSILFLFTFVETGSKEAAPVLTIQTTR